jgi:lysophospholipase L1-like esterase
MNERAHPRSFVGLAALLLVAVSGCGANTADPYAGQSDADVASGGSGGSSTPTGMTAGSGGGGSGGAAVPDAGASGGTSGGSGGTAPASGGSGGTAGPSGGTTGAGAPRPARLVVLGDSITACSNVGGKMADACSLKKLYDYVKATYAPALVYDNQAVGGAVSADVPRQQLAAVKPGPGRVLVVVYVGGNDLAKYIFSSDAAATTGLMTDLPGVLSAWDQIFAYFEDKTKFPDGYTLVMSSQYNPFDDCTALPYNVTAKKFELLHAFNDQLASVAQKKGATITDQYTPFLGHGHHYNVMKCPHFMPGAANWMGDLIHPNPVGHADLFEQWKKTIDALYR